jgi:uncharacterized protein YodC (DUF2158 family)
MTEQQFKVGDVVMLKSGGPTMTVGSIAPGGVIECLWFDKNNEQQHAAFSPATLEHYSPGF